MDDVYCQMDIGCCEINDEDVFEEEEENLDAFKLEFNKVIFLIMFL